MSTQYTSHIVVHNAIDGERVAGRFSNYRAAADHASTLAAQTPNQGVAVYERKVIFTARVVVDDDLPKVTSA
jgi:hypothetical protein